MANWLNRLGTLGSADSVESDAPQRQRGIPRWRRAVSPPWLPPVVAATAIVIGVLAALVERGGLDGVDDPQHLSRTSIAMIVLVAAAWLVETAGVPWPRLVFVATVVLPSAWFVYAGRNTVAPMFLILLVGWGAYTWPRRDAFSTLLACILGVLMPLAWGADPASDWIPWLFGISLSWLSMYAVGQQRRLLAELRIAQADLARQAAARERQRIARDVHDVIAHTLAITMLHLTGARHILTRDPERAAEALAQAERLGRQSLADIRRTVGLLADHDRQDRPSGGDVPLPTIADLPALISDYARAGLDVRLKMDGDPGILSAAAGLDLYRIAQEAITNAVKHAPGATVEVSIVIGDDAVILRVEDDGPREGAPALTEARGSSLGLVGMRERAALLGGTLTLGRSGDGWLVECVVPVGSSQEHLRQVDTGERESGA